MTRLSKKQVTTLILAARAAYQYVGSRAAEPLPDFDAWRRQHVFEACGRHGLRDAENKHYSLIAGRFASLAGAEDQAFEHQLRDQTNERRQLEFALVRALESADLPQSYAETISQDRFGAAVTDTSDEQLRMLVMTVKSRARAKRQRRQSEEVCCG